MTTNLFQNKYRISSSRLQSWNYANQGIYFVTVCTSDRISYFGEIQARKMVLSELGTIVESEWLKTIELRKDMNLQIGDYVVMPNHFHGILIIGANQYNNPIVRGRDAMHGVSTNAMDGGDVMHHVSTQGKFGPQSKNLASIIRGFKSSVTTYARKNNIAFGWQPRFHEHIVRSFNEYNRISEYIQNNPANWKEDRFNPTTQH
jgi:putative transposase